MQTDIISLLRLDMVKVKKTKMLNYNQMTYQTILRTKYLKSLNTFISKGVK